MDHQKSLHITMFPWFAMGHFIPYLQLSNDLAQRGHKISFLLPKKAKRQLQHLSLNLHPDLITFHLITVPHVDGIPPGTETASDIHISLSGHLATAMDLTRDQVDYYLRDLRPDFVFYDKAYWIPELATQIGFKTVCYNVACATAYAICLVPARCVPKDRPLTEAELAVPPPGYPSTSVVFRQHEVHSAVFICYEFGSGITFYERISTAMKNCNAIAFRTCYEVEGSMCDYIASQYGKPMLLTGPVLPEPAQSHLEKDQWAEWLKQFNPGSVVFCALGSQLILEKPQFQELLLGFELSGLPFLVAIKPPQGVETVEEAFPKGFEERVKGRGLVHGGWVPQSMILGHPSIGCFVSHGGFGSMWESLMSDAQIVLLPNYADHILQARLLTAELKVGVEVEKDEKGWFPKEGVSMAIKCVMDQESEVGRMVRKNHATWKQTLGSPGFMSGYIDKFVENLYHL